MATWRDREERKRTRDDFEVRDGPSRGKRGRWSDPGYRGGRDKERELSTEDRLISFIIRVGEKTQSSIDSNIETLAETICHELAEYKDKILQVITKCAREFSEKTTVYSTLVGILNARKFDIGEELVDLLLEDLKSALSLNKFNTVKTLVRFLADLVNAKVVPSSSIISLFDTFITVTYEPGISQLRSDWYTYLVLSALPWVGGELQSKRQVELGRLLSAIESYMNKRTTNYLPALQVWQTDRPYPQRDQLELLWTQILRMKEEGWKESVLLRPYTSFDAEITSAYTHPLPNIVVPGHTLDSTYPLPTCVFQCIGEADLPAHIGPNLPPVESIDRYLVQDLIHSTIASHSANRKDCAVQLNTLMERLQNLPIENLIAEVLFGLMFQLPSPPNCPLYYASLTIELCKLRAATYPMILAQYTNMVFSQLDHINYVVADRFAWWFSYHLSNFQYFWDWTKWLWCLQCPPDHTANWFIQQVFERCTRLGSYEVFSEHVPESYLSVLPPPPQSNYLYDEESDDPGTTLANKLIEAMHEKLPVEDLLSIIDSAPSYIPDDIMDDRLSELKISVLTQTVLHIGDKTISHCFTALHKFRSLFLELLDTEEAKLCCLSSVDQFFKLNPQLHSFVLDRLVRQEIVENVTIIKWLFTSPTHPDFTSRLTWDIVRSCCTRVTSSLHQTGKMLDDVKEKLTHTSGLDDVAGGIEERQELEWRIRELEEKVDEKKKEQREVFLAICQYLVVILSDHLTHCDQEALDYETSWFSCILDNLRQVLVQNYEVYHHYIHLLENEVFTGDTDPRILEIYQQFQALL